MRVAALDYLACPKCTSNLTLLASATEDDEVMEGALKCPTCKIDYPIRRGVPRFTAHSEGHAPTAEAFGWQWKRFSELEQRYRQQFLDWIRPWTAERFRDQVVLEAGCGKGRHTALAAEFGARAVVAVDLSDAVDPAFMNTREHSNTHIVQADLNFLPVKPVFDYAFSVGVLHHLPDPERGFRSLVSRIRKGGRVSAWVYGREGNGWIVHLVSPIRERVTSKMPRRLLAALATALTVPLWIAVKLVFGPAHRRGIRLPYGGYLGYVAVFPFRELKTIVFDHLVAPVAHYLRREEFAGWFERSGLDEVNIEHHNENSWRGFARVPEA